MQLHRHDLLRAHACAWEAMLQCRPDLAQLPLVVQGALYEHLLAVHAQGLFAMHAAQYAW